jgi:hypothetical protein
MEEISCIFELNRDGYEILNEKEIKGLKKIIKTSLKYGMKDMIMTIFNENTFKKVFKYYEISELKKLLSLSKKCENIKYYKEFNNISEYVVYDNLRDLIEILIYDIDEDKRDEYWKII